MALVSDFSDVPFGNEAAWEIFLQQHALAHQAVAAALAAKGKSVSVVIMPDPVTSLEDWLMTNNQAHQQEVTAIGLNVANINDVDLEDKEQYEQWMLLHAQIHAATNNALGL